MKKLIQSPNFNLTIYTIMHFLVDLACIFFLMGMVYVMLPDSSSRLKAAVIYNMLAFALPMLLGFLADITGFNAFTSCLGCIMIAMAYVFIPRPWVSVALIGVGNGLFHIGGGRQVLQDAGSRFSPSGIFISSGALGVFLGRKMSVAFRQLFFISLECSMAVCAALLLIFGILQMSRRRRSVPSAQKISAGLIAVSVLIFIVVIIRSYYGFVAVYSWNNTFLTGLIFTLCIAAGKFIGGIVADKAGIMPACIISLGGAAVTALFSQNSPVAGCISILLFNMTMPITLTLLAEVWKELPGFAFGTLMMALFLGTVPDMVLNLHLFSGIYSMMGLCLLSLVLLTVSVMMIRKNSSPGN